MYKSAISLLVANLLMAWIVSLNNEGPGWEVPSYTMANINIASVLVFAGLACATACLIVSWKQIKIRSVLFNITYFVMLLLAVSSVVFLLWVQGFDGQSWSDSFPKPEFTREALINPVLSAGPRAG